MSGKKYFVTVSWKNYAVIEVMAPDEESASEYVEEMDFDEIKREQEDFDESTVTIDSIIEEEK
tara:strand:- start:9969 stop:10157 length:189 start_codon:yes stop_codon:yes gene_type:complete